MRAPLFALLALIASALALGATAAGAIAVSGRLGSPTAEVPALKIYAWSKSEKRLYSTTSAARAPGYTLELPPGRYWLFAVPDEPGAPPVYGAHTRFSVCARDPVALGSGACSNHELIDVEVGHRKVEGADLSDWSLEEDTEDALDRLLGRSPGESWTAAELAAPKFSEYPAVARVASRAGSLADLKDARGARDQAALQTALSSGQANFAGSFALLRVPCGSGCEDVALLDLTKGTVTYPEVLNPLPVPPCAPADALGFRRSSRLLTVTGQDGTALLTRYFELSPDSAELKTVASLARVTAACPPAPAPP